MTIEFIVRALVQALAVHFLLSTLLSLGAAGYWWALVRRVPARLPADQLFVLRLLPSLAGVVAALLVLIGYALWEARTDRESVGVPALVCAVGGLTLLVSAASRSLAVLTHTRRIRQALGAAATEPLGALPFPAFVVESSFPVVVVVGLVRARLFVARRVLEACTPDELDAVIAHEQAHARRHDNLRRLAMAGAPDVLGLTPLAHRLHDRWMAATELAADRAAAERSTSGLDLASALVKVARLATTPVGPLTASALYRGEPITERVHRLLDPPAAAARRPWPRWARLAAWALVASLGASSLPVLHDLAEWVLGIGAR